MEKQVIQFEIVPENITPYFKHLIGAVESSQVMQILAHVHVQLDKGHLIMTTSNTEMEVCVSIPVSITQEHPVFFTVSARKLADILRLISPALPMYWSIDNQWITIQTGSIQYKLASLEADRFPFLPFKEPGSAMSISAVLLKKLIDETAFGIAKQDIRIYLNGLLLDMTPGAITAVASDSYRMCLRTSPFEDVQHQAMQAIIPKKTALELSKLLASVAEDRHVDIAFAENIMYVSCQEWSLRSHLIDAHYPPYRRIMIKSAKAEVSLSVSALKTALGHISICVNERFRGVQIIIEDNLLVLKSSNFEQEEAVETMPITYAGPMIDLSIGLGYLLDVISAVGSDYITFKVSEDNKSIVIIPDNDPHALYMIMSFTL